MIKINMPFLWYILEHNGLVKVGLEVETVIIECLLQLEHM